MTPASNRATGGTLPRNHLVIGLLGLGCLTSACADNDDEASSGPTCEWFEGDNCYKALMSAAAACLPPGNTRGQTAGDEASCVYSDGHAVEFLEPIANWGTGPWHVRQTTAGVPCLELEATQSSLVLTGAAGTFRRESGADMRIECPDGKTHVVGLAAASGCDPRHVPRMTWRAYAAVVLQGTGVEGGTLLFDCNPPL